MTCELDLFGRVVDDLQRSEQGGGWTGLLPARHFRQLLRQPCMQILHQVGIASVAERQPFADEQEQGGGIVARLSGAERHSGLFMGGVMTPMVGRPAESRHARVGGDAPLARSGGEVRAADLRPDLADLIATAAEPAPAEAGA